MQDEMGSASSGARTPSPLDATVAAAFIGASRAYLRDEYPGKIRGALHALPEADLWWRPNSASNAVGNLVLHMAGNLRQWVVHGIGGAADVRRRSEEFVAPGGQDQAGGAAPPDRASVLGVLEGAIVDADEVLAALEADTLLAPRTIQGREVTVLRALYHVVEHVSMHTGQILWIVKLRTGRDLAFYDVDDAGRIRGTRW